MTAPYHPALPELLEDSLEHYAQVTAHPRTGDPFVLAVEEAGLSVTFSEDWSPHIQASVRCSVPASTAHLDALDARKLCRLTVDAGYVLPDRSPDVHLLADLGLTERRVRRPDNTMELAAASDEYRAQEFRNTPKLSTVTVQGMAEAVTSLAGQAMAPDTISVASEFPAGYKASLTSGTEVEAGTPFWDVIADLAEATDTWVHVAGDRTWRVRRRPAVGGVPVHTMATGARGTVTGTDSGLSLDGWANEVLVRYRWKNATAEQDIIGRARATSGPFATSAVGRRMAYYARSTGTTQAKADAAARTILGQLVTRGRSLTLTGAAAYWLRPGDTITVQLPTGGAEDHLVQSVTFRPFEGLMDVVTRQPLNLTITTGE